MGYGNYDEAYIQPNCDQCGKTLKKRYEYTPIRIEAAKETRGIRTSVHDGHLCTSCNEIYDLDPDECPASAANKIVFHFTGSDPARLLMVDVLEPHKIGGELKSSLKYEPEDVPEYLRKVGTAIVSTSAGIKSVDYDHDRMDEMVARYHDAVKAAHPARNDGE